MSRNSGAVCLERVWEIEVRGPVRLEFLTTPRLANLSPGEIGYLANEALPNFSTTESRLVLPQPQLDFRFVLSLPPVSYTSFLFFILHSSRFASISRSSVPQPLLYTIRLSRV